MNSELMTVAICWEIGAKVAVEFAYHAKDLFYFCPDANCLAEVVPAKINNAFFRAPGSHAPGCANEKKKTTESPEASVPISRKSIVPPRPIPSHLGPIARLRRGKRPSDAQKQELALRSRVEPLLHHGTFLEVVNAWCSMKDVSARQSHPLHIASQPQTYYDAFSPLSHESKEGTLNSSRKILYGYASVSDFNHSLYVKTKTTFKVGEKTLPIKIRIRSSDALYPYLKSGQEVMLFLHGPIPELDKYIEIRAADAYNGMVITRRDLSPLDQVAITASSD
jgi:hypothetical protein